MTPEKIWQEYEKCRGFNTQINLDHTVEENENFFIGKQWEGVVSNGLPTPIFNFLKRVTLFQVASITSDNLKINASPLVPTKEVRRAADLLNREFVSLFEHNKITIRSREFMRNAAVDGDGCFYTYWDADAETGQTAKGAIVTEILENTRVFFGNANERDPQKQPYIIIEKHMMVDDVREKVSDKDAVQPDAGDGTFYTGDKVTVLLKLFKKDGTIHGYECTKNTVVREEWDLGIRRYPIVWLNWDYVQDCYHGQALITGLIPNQIFVNKAYAMTEMSLMMGAFPKTIYDKTRVDKWTNKVGEAIAVRGGDVTGVAKILEPAQISPQVSQFIQQAVDHTQTFLGATSAALGDTRPDNTSAIIALQKASSVPSEITRQNYHESLEDLARIYMEFMAENYGTRTVYIPAKDVLPPDILQFSGQDPDELIPQDMDFSMLKDMPMHIKLDAGASSYWSEVATAQTLDNLMQLGAIDLVDYLERVPDGYITKREDLIAKHRNAAATPGTVETQNPMGVLQEKLQAV